MNCPGISFKLGVKQHRHHSTVPDGLQKRRFPLHMFGTVAKTYAAVYKLMYFVAITCACEILESKVSLVSKNPNSFHRDYLEFPRATKNPIGIQVVPVGANF